MKEGPAAVWIVFTTHQWEEEHRELVPRDVATLVCAQAMHILCRGCDEATTQRTINASMPYNTQATLWEEAQLTRLPASITRNDTTQLAARLAPEISMSLRRILRVPSVLPAIGLLKVASRARGCQARP